MRVGRGRASPTFLGQLVDQTFAKAGQTLLFRGTVIGAIALCLAVLFHDWAWGKWVLPHIAPWAGWMLDVISLEGHARWLDTTSPGYRDPTEDGGVAALVGLVLVVAGIIAYPIIVMALYAMAEWLPSGSAGGRAGVGLDIPSSPLTPVKGWVVLMSMLGSGGRGRLIDLDYHEAQWQGGRMAVIAGTVVLLAGGGLFLFVEGIRFVVLAGLLAAGGLLSMALGARSMAGGVSYRESTRRELAEFQRRLQEIVVTKARLPHEMAHEVKLLAMQQSHETRQLYLQQQHRELMVAATQPFKLQMEAMSLPATLMMLEGQIRAEDKVAQFESLLNRSRGAINRIQQDALEGVDPVTAQANRQQAAEMMLELLAAWAQRL